MEVVLGKTAGFCPGVRNAVQKAEEVLEENEHVYCLGEIVHNVHVVEKLQKMGLIVIDNLNQVPKGEKVIIRAHGVPKSVYEEAEKKQIVLIDLTCQKVLKVHKIVEQDTLNHEMIFYLGIKDHPETIGTQGFSKENFVIIEEEKDIQVALSKIKGKDVKKIDIIAQTTFSVEKFNILYEEIIQRLPAGIDINVHQTICHATKLRQEETEKMAKAVELMVIIGGKNSSNTKKLYDIALKICRNAILVENTEDLYLNYIARFKKIGVMAGASTPQNMIKEVVNILEKTQTKGYIHERIK